MKTDTTQEAPRVDVVIYNIKTRVISTMAGVNMIERARYEGCYSQSAEKRMETVSPRLNDDYGVRIVETGKFKPGDLLPRD